MSAQRNRELILNGNMYRVLLTLAIPIMLSSLIQTFYDLADTFWVSRIDEIQVAAISFIGPIIFLQVALGMGINVAGTALISQYIGAGNKKDAPLVGGQILLFSLVFSTTMAILGSIFAKDIVLFLGPDPEIIESATSYLRIIFIGLPTMFVFFAFNAMKHGQGNTVTPTILTASSALLNVVLDPIFIFTFNMGIAGAAIATVLSRAIFAVVALYLIFDPNGEMPLKRHHLKFNPKLFGKITSIGLPSCIGQSATSIGFIVLNTFIVSYGYKTMAAFGIGNRINNLVLMPVMGVGSALTAIIGQNLGADNVDRAGEAIKKSAILSVIFMATGGVTVAILAKPIIRIFASDPEVISQGVEYIRWIAVSLPLMGIFQVFMSTFQGSGHTMYSMFLAMGRLWAVRIPLIMYFSRFTNQGASGIWYSMILSNAITCAVGYGLFLTGVWKKKVIKGGSKQMEEVLEG